MPDQENNGESQKHRLSQAGDLPDSPHDEERMKPEEVILDLPDVADIPGQEHVFAPALGELADTTISSDDEEGVGLFDDEDDDDSAIFMGTDADVTGSELSMLQNTDEETPTTDNIRLREAGLDTMDFEGEMLNEGSLGTDVSGADLDISGADADDAAEAIGEEDEENNAYSLGSDSNDNITGGTP